MIYRDSCRRLSKRLTLSREMGELLLVLLAGAG